MKAICRQCGREYVTFPSYQARRPNGGYCSHKCADVAPPFDARVQRGAENECWLWTGGKKSRFGYGAVTVQGQSTYAHRAAWVYAHGPIPAGMCVLHRCDVPACVNPAHLFLGTQADNNRDRHAKGRDGRHGRKVA